MMDGASHLLRTHEMVFMPAGGSALVLNASHRRMKYGA